uniref:ZAD domain-containing protein n=1 Tax=Anopheles culicifacies TaxID=139723 RepID=A0A182LSX4_9DIPT
MSEPSRDQSFAPIILLNGLPVKTAYMAKCRLCLGSNFGDKSTTIIEEGFSNMLRNITNQIGLPMNVCSKCRRGVELFFKYTNKVIANQKKLQETFIPVSYQQTGNNTSAAQEIIQNPNTDRGAGQLSIVEIVSDDEAEKYDNTIPIDMQCEPATDNGVNENDPLLQTSPNVDPQINFVAVPCTANIFVDTETFGHGHKRKKVNKPVADEPLVIETIYLSDEEYEDRSAEAGRRPRNAKQKKHASKHSLPVPTPSQADEIDATIEAVVNFDKSVHNLTGGVTMVYYEADENEELVEEVISPAPPPKRSLRITNQEQNANRRLQAHKNGRNSHEKRHKNL